MHLSTSYQIHNSKRFTKIWKTIKIEDSWEGCSYSSSAIWDMIVFEQSVVQTSAKFLFVKNADPIFIKQS